MARSSRCHNVCLSGTNLTRSVKLHLSRSDLQVVLSAPSQLNYSSQLFLNISTHYQLYLKFSLNSQGQISAVSSQVPHGLGFRIALDWTSD